MAKKKKEFKVPSRKQPCFKFFKPFWKMIFKRPNVINLAGEIADKAIVVSNHSAKSGPPCLELYYPKFTAKWGAYQMLGDFKSRYRYLRDVLYIQKLHKKPFGSTIKAAIMGVLSPMVYKAMKMMPSYPDGRLMSTIKDSCKILDAGMSVMVFPEDSNDGYYDMLTQCFPGFVMLAEKYYRATGEDVPVYPVHYHVKKRVLVIGKPIYVQDLVKQGLDRYQIADVYCKAINKLYYDYVENYQGGKKSK